MIVDMVEDFDLNKDLQDELTVLSSPLCCAIQLKFKRDFNTKLFCNVIPEYFKNQYSKKIKIKSYKTQQEFQN